MSIIEGVGKIIKEAIHAESMVGLIVLMLPDEDGGARWWHSWVFQQSVVAAS